MKKIFFIVLIVVIILLGGFIFFKNNSGIKEGDIWVNVKFKNEIPKIDSRNEAGVLIEDADTNTTYFINYNQIVSGRPLIVVNVTNNDRKGNKKSTTYAYSWKELEEDLENHYVFMPKGWSIHTQENKYDNEYSSISECPIESINGKVISTNGDTSVIKKIFDLK